MQSRLRLCSEGEPSYGTSADEGNESNDWHVQPPAHRHGAWDALAQETVGVVVVATDVAEVVVGVVAVPDGLRSWRTVYGSPFSISTLRSYFSEELPISFGSMPDVC